jgi:hypothetical protein
MSRLVWTLRQLGGAPLTLALLLGGIGWLLEGGLAPRWLDDATRLREQALALQRDARDAELLALQAAGSPDRASALQLPAAGTASSRMADLLALAVLNGVTVQRLQRVGADAAENAGRTPLVMPVRASYADLRSFIAQALREDAALALERISLRRSRSHAAELEGELQWTLLHRNAKGAAP